VCAFLILSWALTTLTEVFHSFPQSLQLKGRILSQLGHDHFLSNPFQFIIHQFSFSLMLYILDNNGVVKEPIKSFTLQRGKVIE
jgi:hypothetical protein